MNKTKSVYAPYKEYLWGFIRFKKGWKDLGLSKKFGEGEYKKYNCYHDGHTFSGEEEVQYSSICNQCREVLRLGQSLKDKQVFCYCPKCKKIYKPFK